MPSSPSESLPRGGADLLERDRLERLLEDARERTLWLVEPVATEDLERVHDPLMSPIVWDLAHIAAFEDLWLNQRAGGHEPLRPDLMDLYDAAETPRSWRGELPLLDTCAARRYLDDVRERALAGLAGARPDGPLTESGFVWEMVAVHEHQHNETMLQTLALAREGVYAPPHRSPQPPRHAAVADREIVEIPAGEATLGADDRRFGYDNERPRHTAKLAAFEIDREPVSNGAFLEFVEDGGYERGDCWSAAGLEWREREQVRRPLYWSDDGGERRFDAVDSIEPDLPVMHVSWFEADAYARWRGKRLPTEQEWERAAGGPEGTRVPWGESPADVEHANLDQLAFGPAPCGSYPQGASIEGALGLLGDAWEWTASDFHAYRGFEAFPYERYSAVFFGGPYKVLRGGSWASRPHAICTSTRNWDLPQRRQIFAGFRCARDLPSCRRRRLPRRGGRR